ncbi:POTRA domain-containing protein [Pseudomonas petrae]|uniref:POTRA domain-containing protein n=1 Tax=Pseudomonas petrae TaxID=2912190 RepID=UPI001EEFB5F9|nr:POTRA domain-containing protein [Pseudomonas petrae]MCF7531173.1 hypothetical protein [Pseudomonas petrae]MCF7554529.1 hypothetical protein [Pseudomonas petrae]
MHSDARCSLLKIRAARRFVAVTRFAALNAKHLVLTALATCTLFVAAAAQAAGPEEELLKQQERERVLRDQLESRPDVRLQAPKLDEGGARLPAKEAPCFAINDIRLIGDASEQFQWALKAANPKDDPAVGRCLGGAGINMTMKRMQNAIIEAGYVTTRVLAEAQDLNSRILVLTIVPGRIREIRFAEGTKPYASHLGRVIKAFKTRENNDEKS